MLKLCSTIKVCNPGKSARVATEYRHIRRGDLSAGRTCPIDVFYLDTAVAEFNIAKFEIGNKI
jgi:hypothetical protein